VAPENTLASFARALDEGADGIELDVRLARDGVPVVIHDATLMRTGGLEGVVAKMTSAELGKINVGGWFNRKHAGLARAEYDQQFVPTLDQVFVSLKNQLKRQSVIYVEMKTSRRDGSSIDLPQLVPRVIAAHQLEKQVVIVSFNLKAIATVKQVNASIRTGALFEPRPRAIEAIRKRSIMARALDCGATEILLHRLIVRPRLVSLATEAGLVPVVWTVDDPKWIARAKNYGIHALITNNPAKLLGAVGRAGTDNY